MVTKKAWKTIANEDAEHCFEIDDDS